MTTIALARDDAEIARCFPVMAQLRTGLRGKAEFLGQVKRQMSDAGYRLAYLEDGGRVVAVAGFRVSEWLAWGKAMYVDDLVTDGEARGRGHGGELLDWLAARAEAEGCRELHLDSAVVGGAAHRFYFRKGMEIRSYHFHLALD